MSNRSASDSNGETGRAHDFRLPSHQEPPFSTVLWPKWISGSRAMIEPAQLLTAKVLKQRICGSFGCEQISPSLHKSFIEPALGIVAGACHEIGLAAWLDAQDPDRRHQVSVGTATVTMVPNGLGFSNRQLYLVPQFFAHKPVEHLLGPGITAEMLNDDCLGRTLDWLYEHDLTKLFAGLASCARQIFGVKAEHIHVDTTSFSVSGQYVREADKLAGAEAAVIAITYGYSRDHREDLKQWMLALASTHQGDIPLFMQPLDGNSSDKVSLLSAILAPQTQLRETNGETSVYVADNGVYSEANMRRLNQAGVKWISRVSETLTEVSRLLEEGSESWQQSADGMTHWFSRQMSLHQGDERWIVISTQASVERVPRRHNGR